MFGTHSPPFAGDRPLGLLAGIRTYPHHQTYHIATTAVVRRGPPSIAVRARRLTRNLNLPRGSIHSPGVEWKYWVVPGYGTAYVLVGLIHT